MIQCSRIFFQTVHRFSFSRVPFHVQLASLARGLSAHRDRAVARSFALQLFCAQLASLSAAHRPWLAARISLAWRALTAGASAPHFAVGLEAAGHSLHTELSASFFALVKALLEYVLPSIIFKKYRAKRYFCH